MNFFNRNYTMLFRRRKYFILFLAYTAGIVLCCLLVNGLLAIHYISSEGQVPHIPIHEEVIPPFEKLLSPDLKYFTDSNNETGYSKYIVPNIVHFIRLNQEYVEFNEMICIKSAYLNQRPKKIMIHCDKCQFYGKYWDMIKDIDVLQIHHVTPPKEVFGKSFGYTGHRIDVLKIIILQEYGGIILDNDVYVVQSLDNFRLFEMTLGWPYDDYLANQVLIAHKNARFLKHYYKSYEFYVSYLCYYNAGILPTKAILWKRPDLVHREPNKFGVHGSIKYRLYKMNWAEWEDQYTIHLFACVGCSFMKLITGKSFDEENIKTYDQTYGQMARLIYYGTKDLLPEKGNRLIYMLCTCVGVVSTIAVGKTCIETIVLIIYEFCGWRRR